MELESLVVYNRSVVTDDAHESEVVDTGAGETRAGNLLPLSL